MGHDRRDGGWESEIGGVNGNKNDGTFIKWMAGDRSSTLITEIVSLPLKINYCCFDERPVL
jgi:hypothetical protein